MLAFIIKFVHFIEIFYEIIDSTEHTLGLKIYIFFNYTFLLKFFEPLTLNNKKYIFQSGWLLIE